MTEQPSQPASTVDVAALAAAERARPRLRSRGALPRPLAWAASLAAAAVAVALAWLSAANHALVPFLWGVDLGIHEFGHLVTFWAPAPVTAAAGSAFQLLVPLGLAAYFLLVRREPRAAAILSAWAGTSARNVAVYVADAPYQRLELWGGDGVQHDWAFLLRGPLLRYAGALAAAVEVLAWALIGAAVVLALAPVIAETARALRERAADRAFAAGRSRLPVREPHGPLG